MHFPILKVKFIFLEILKGCGYNIIKNYNLILIFILTTFKN